MKNKREDRRNVATECEADKKPRDSRQRNSTNERIPKEGKQGNRRAKYGFNDPSWYAKNPQLMKDAASLAFANFQGVPIHDTGMGSKDFNPMTIMTLDYIPTFGKAKTAVDALNIATRNIYSYVRHANSGHTNYEPADLGIYLLAVTEVMGLIAHLDRLYGISRVYSVKNRVLPRQLLIALGCNPDDFLANQATFRYNINRLKLKIASLCIPKGMSLIERRFWMNTFTFKDADTDKASLYVFKPHGFWKYNPTRLSNGGCLEFNKFLGGSNNTTGQMIAAVEQAIDVILGDEDMNIMSGDILKAYGESGLINISLTPEELINIPVYQPEVLPQIHNSVAYGVAPGGTDKLVTEHLSGVTGYSGTIDLVLQQKNSILYNVLYYGHLDGSGNLTCDAATSRLFPSIPLGTVLLDEPMDSPEPSDVMVATRLHPAVNVPDIVPASSYLELASFGTEIIVNYIVLRVGDTSLSNALVITSNVGGKVVMGGNTVDYIGALAPYLSEFDMHPLIYVKDGNQNPGTDSVYWSDFSFEDVLGDLYNFTAISNTELNKTHTTAVISEFSIGDFFESK